MKRIVCLLVSLLVVMVGCDNKIMANKTSQIGIKLFVDNVEVEVDWEENDSVNQLIEITKKNDIVIAANQYGGFEQVGVIGHNIISNNVQMTAEPGDIVLYNNSNIVVFFGSNAWSYTKLGKIKNKTKNELSKLLNKNKVVFTLKNTSNNLIDNTGNEISQNKTENVYRALEEGVAESKIRSIGISNYYTKEAFDKVMSYAKIIPSVIQNENHIYYQNNDLREYVEKYGVVIESYFPFGGRGNTKDSLNNDVVVELAKKYNKTAAQIILRWNLQSNYIAIPGSSNELHIKENNEVYDFILSEEDMKKITDINKNQRYANW